MKKHLLKSLLLTLMVLVGGSAWAGDKTVVRYSFDDASSPSLTAASKVNFDYTGVSAITSTKFLNIWSAENNRTGVNSIPLNPNNRDLSSKTWTLTYYWAGLVGGNKKDGNIYLKAGDTNLFRIQDAANYEGKMTLTYGESGTANITCPNVTKAVRFSANTKTLYNTETGWYKFTVTGDPTDGVKLTIAPAAGGDAVVSDIVLSATNVTPTELTLALGSIASYGIDDLAFTFYVEGEVIEDPVIVYTAVNDINRTVSATCATEGATLYYSLDNETWTEGASVTVSESGKIYFKAVKGTSESDVISFDAVAGEAITLNAPAIVRSDNKTVTITADQTNLLLSPIATITYEYGNEKGSFTGSKVLTVSADATITAYAEAEGYTNSVTSELAVALFPTYVNKIENTAAATKGWSANAFSEETKTVSERTYAALMLDDAQWGTNVYFQTDGAWGFRSSGNWYINSDTEESWILMPNMKKGDIIVVDASYPASSTVNATYSKYAYGTKFAYEVTEDGDVELAFKKIDANTMDYLYGVYAYTAMTEAEIALFDAKAAFQADITAVKAIDTIGKQGAAELAAAITAAETAIAAEDATVESIAAAKAALAEAVNAFKVANFDIATAIVNAAFDPTANPLGWTVNASGGYRDINMYQIGGEQMVRIAAPTADETHLNTEYAAGFECRWNGNFAAYQQTTAELPAGSYKLTFDVENVNGATQNVNYDNLFTVTVGETVYTDKSTEWMKGKSAWTNHSIAFTLTEAAPVTISLGYGTGSNNISADVTPALYVSHLQFNTCDPLVEAKAEANAAIAALAPIGEGLFFYNQTDIDAAKAAVEAAETVEAVAAVAMPTPNAPAADKAYAIANATATGNLCITEGKVSVAKDATVYFTAVEGGYVLSNEAGDYITRISNDWTLSTSKTIGEAYVVTIIPVEGGYTIKGEKGLFGLDNTAEGSTVYANKAQSNNGLWIIKEGPVDVTNLIVNADLSNSESTAWNTEGTKGYHSVGGVVTVANDGVFDFKQTIANLPAGKYKVTAQAAYRYGDSEQAEYDAIVAGTETKLAKLYATVGEKTVEALVQNRWEGASETNIFTEDASKVSTVNEKFVPNSTAAVKAWFTAGKYVNELVFNVPEDGAATIGIVKTAKPGSDYTVIGPWTLTRLGDADAEVEPEPEPTPEPGADMTKYIVNPSFENGTTGWTYEPSNDHGAKENSNGTYTMTNCDGAHLFNIWSSGNAISQKVEGLPNGTYKLKAVIATDAGQKVQLNANGKSVQIDAVDKGTGVEGELEFNVLDSTATIGAEGVNKYWYKVDNFRLTYVKGFDIADLVTAYETILAEAQAIEGDMNADVKTALNAAIATEVDKTNADALLNATAALTAATSTAKTSVAAYAKAKDLLLKMKQFTEETNVYTAEALASYYTQWAEKYEANTLTTEEADALQDPYAQTGWQHDASMKVDDLLLSAWTIGKAKAKDYETALYINTWSVEGNNDGTNFKVPFFEYWTNDDKSLAADTLTATMSGLEAGDYDVTAWVRVRTKNEAGTEVSASGITMQVNEGEAANVADGATKVALDKNNNFFLKEVTATGTVAEDGELKINFNVAADNNISWLSFKNVKFEKKPFKPEAIEGALYSWESPEGLPGEYGGKISYENGVDNRLNYKNAGYYTICLNGKKTNMNDTIASANASYMLVALDEALSEGDTINITAYVNKNQSKKASAYILFDNGADVESPVYSDEANIDTLFNGVPTTKSIIVTEAMAGAKSFKMTRGQTGTNLFITKFVIMKKKVEPVELAQTLNVERYAGLGYTAQEATVDFTEAKTFLGVEAITTDMLRIVNPNDSLISDYTTYDGWFNGEGAAETWGTNTKINVKFFEAIPEGNYTICDMNGADSIGAVYTVKWALVANDKQVTYTINVKFVEKPVITLTFADLNKVDEKTVALTSELGKFYEGLTADVDVAAILAKLEVTSLDDLTIYAVQTDGTLDDNYKLGTTDGWRDSTGNWQTWGDNAYFFVKADFTKESAQIYEAGGMEGKNTTAQWQSPATYTATYAFVKTGTADAVVLKVTLTYTVPTGINAIARDAQKNTIFNLNGQKVNKAQRGLYIINGKRVMVK